MFEKASTLRKQAVQQAIQEGVQKEIQKIDWAAVDRSSPDKLKDSVQRQLTADDS